MSQDLSGVESSRPAGCKDLEAGACLVHLRSNKQPSVARAEGTRGSIQGAWRSNQGSRER